MVEQLYTIRAGHPIRQLDGSVVNTPHIVLRSLEVDTGRVSAFGRIHGTPTSRQSTSMGNIEINLGSDPDLNLKKLMDVRRDFGAKIVTQIKDSGGFDPAKLEARAMGRLGVDVRSVSTGQMKVVADSTIPVDARLYGAINLGDHHLPPDLHLNYKIFIDRDGNKKIAVSPIMSRFTLDFDGDVVFVRELGIRIRGRDMTSTTVTKFPLMASYGSWNKLDGRASDGMAVIRGINEADLIDRFGKPLLDNKQLTDADMASLARVEMAKALESMRNVEYNAKTMERAVAKSMVPDVIGQVHNRTYALNRQMFADWLETQAKSNPDVRAVMDNRALLDAVWLNWDRTAGMGVGTGIQHNTERMKYVEDAIKAVKRGASNHLSTNRGMNSNIGITGPEKVMRKHKNIDSLQAHQLSEYFKIINADGKFEDNLAAFTTGQGWDLASINPISKYKMRTEVRQHTTTASPSNLIRQMTETGELRAHHITVNSPMPKGFEMGRNRITLFEALNEAGQYAPVLGGQTEMYGATRAKFGFALQPVHVVGESGYKFMDGADFMERELGRRMKSEDMMIRDFRLEGGRLPGQAAGRFDREWVMSREGLGDLRALVRESGMSEQEVRSLIRRDGDGLNRLVGLHDRSVHGAKYKRLGSLMQDHLAEFGEEIVYQDTERGIRITDLNRQVLSKYHRIALDVEFADSGQYAASMLERLPASVREMLKLHGAGPDGSAGIEWAESKYRDPITGHTRTNRRSGRVLIANGSMFDPKREVGILSQQLNSTAVNLNMALVDIDWDRLLAIHQKSHPEATMADLRRLFNPAIQNGVGGPGEGSAWLLDSGYDKTRAAWANQITPGYDGFDAATGLPRKVTGKYVGPAWKTEITEVEQGIRAHVNGEAVDMIMPIDNVRGGWGGFAQTMRDGGHIYDPTRADMGFRTEYMHFSGRKELEELGPIPVRMLRNYTGGSFTADSTDQKGGYMEHGVGDREVMGPENQDKVLSDLVAERLHIERNILGRDLTVNESRSLGLETALVGRDVQRELLGEKLGGGIVNVRESAVAFDMLNRVAGSDVASEAAARMITNVAKAQAIRAAEQMGMMDGVAFVMKNFRF